MKKKKSLGLIKTIMYIALLTGVLAFGVATFLTTMFMLGLLTTFVPSLSEVVWVVTMTYTVTLLLATIAFLGLLLMSIKKSKRKKSLGALRKK